jgi:hypothetical protein
VFECFFNAFGYIYGVLHGICSIFNAFWCILMNLNEFDYILMHLNVFIHILIEISPSHSHYNVIAMHTYLHICLSIIHNDSLSNMLYHYIIFSYSHCSIPIFLQSMKILNSNSYLSHPNIKRRRTPGLRTRREWSVLSYKAPPQCALHTSIHTSPHIPHSTFHFVTGCMEHIGAQIK